MQNVTTNIICAALGIAIGAAGHAKISELSTEQDVNNDTVSITSPSEHSTSASTSGLVNPSVLGHSTIQNTHKDVGDVDVVVFNTDNESNHAPTAEKLLVHAPPDTNSQNAPPESLAYALDGIKFDTMYSDETEHTLHQVEKWLENSLNPAREIFDLITSDVNDETKSVLKHLVVAGDYAGLTESILNEMLLANEIEYDGWKEIIGIASIDTPDERDAMLNVLPQLTNESLVSATLEAVQPQLLPLEDRTEFLSSISLYGNSENEAVRSAAIITLAKFSDHDYSYMIEDALSSGTEQLKNSAIYATSVGGIRTDAMKNQMSLIMQDETASFALRAQAFDALRLFNLNKQEYNIYYQFYREHIVSMEQDSNR